LVKAHRPPSRICAPFGDLSGAAFLFLDL
jgi:hypothetical protein